MYTNTVQKKAENIDGGTNKNEGQTKPAKHVPIACFYTQNNKRNENNNVNNNKNDVFRDDMEINSEHEEDLIKE